MAEFITYDYLFRNGRLGNQLWQIASTAGIAKDEGAEPRFPKWEYAKYYNVPSEFFGPRSKDCRDLGTDYLQELHYFESVADKVEEWFTPSEIVQKEVESRYPWFFDGGHHTAIHVRRGDYVNLPAFFPPPSLDYYARARGLILETSPHTTFVVFSDDIGWCRKNMSGDNIQFVHGVPRPVEIVDRVGEPEDQYDLALMALCDKHIISNSTFSWWGAYLSGNKEVVYPSVWFGPALNNQRCPAPDTWIELESC